MDISAHQDKGCGRIGARIFLTERETLLATQGTYCTVEFRTWLISYFSAYFLS